MKKTRRVMAIIGIALLLSMYVFCFVFALIKTEQAQAMFRMALAATIAIPIVLYGCLVFTGVMTPKKPEVPPEDGSDPESGGPEGGTPEGPSAG